MDRLLEIMESPFSSHVEVHPRIWKNGRFWNIAYCVGKARRSQRVKAVTLAGAKKAFTRRTGIKPRKWTLDSTKIELDIWIKPEPVLPFITLDFKPVDLDTTFEDLIRENA